MGIGMTSAAFHIGGKNPSLRDALKMAANGWHSNPLKSRRSQFDQLQGTGKTVPFLLDDNVGAIYRERRESLRSRRKTSGTRFKRKFMRKRRQLWLMVYSFRVLV